MRSPFVAAPESDLRRVVERGWGIEIRHMDAVLEGAGAHHWNASAADGGRWFVTCDDLATKPWLGADNDTVFERLGAAYGAAHELRNAGVRSVVAPVPARTGHPAVRLDDRHSVAVCELIDGTPGRWGGPLSNHEIAGLVATLAELHECTSPTAPLTHRGLEVPGRLAFEAAFAELDQPWDAGPLAEAARRTVRDHVEVVDSWLAELTRAHQREQHAPRTVVVTHGEPHPGNLLHTPAGLRLVDWDTIAFAPAERDLWMIADAHPAALAR